MVLRAVKLLLVASWVFVVVVAYALVSAAASESPLRATTVVTVTQWKATGPASDVYRDLEKYATDEGLLIARERTDLTEGRSARTLYFFPGDAQSPTRTSPGDVGGSVTSRDRPGSALEETSPIGQYYLFDVGSRTRTDTDALRGFLRGHGMRAEVTEPSRWVGFDPATRTLLAIALLLISGVVGVGVVASVRTDAIRRLHGHPFWRRRLVSLRGLVGVWAVSGAIACVGVSVYLAVRGEAVALPRVLGVVALLAAAVVAAVLLAETLVGALIAAVPLPRTLKGDLPGWALTTTAYGLRVAAALIALGAVATTLQAGRAMAQQREDQAAFDALGQKATLTQAWAYSQADDDRAIRVVGGWLAALDRRGRVVVAGTSDLGLADPGWAGTRALVVNATYADEQELRDADGRRIEASTDPTTVRILLPPGRWAQRGRVEQAIGLGPLLRDGPRPRVELVRAAPGQRLFDYRPSPEEPQTGGQTGGQADTQASTSAYLADPVVVLMPAGGGLLSDYTYAAYASQAAVIVDDSQTIVDAVAADPALARFVMAATPVASTAAQARAESARTLRSAVLVAGLAALLVVLTGFAAAQVQVARKRQRIFVLFTHGWSPWRTFRAVVAVEAVLVTVVCAWVPLGVLRSRAEYDRLLAAGAIPPLGAPTLSLEQGVAIAVLAAFLIGGFWLSLGACYRTVVRGEVAHR